MSHPTTSRLSSFTWARFRSRIPVHGSHSVPSAILIRSAVLRASVMVNSLPNTRNLPRFSRRLRPVSVPWRCLAVVRGLSSVVLRLLSTERNLP
jgi:hypothetical protein